MEHGIQCCTERILYTVGPFQSEIQKFTSGLGNSCFQRLDEKKQWTEEELAKVRNKGSMRRRTLALKSKQVPSNKGLWEETFLKIRETSTFIGTEGKEPRVKCSVRG